jgi:TP901 family phage tail tape measure protein
MSVKEDKVNLIITINGDKARKELYGLDTEARKLKDEMKGLNKESQEYADKSKRLGEVQARMKELRSEIGQSTKTLKELNQELRSLQAVRQYLVPGTEAFKQNEASIKSVRGRITELNSGIKDTGGVLSVIKGEIRSFGMMAAGFLGFQFLSQQVSNIISKSAKLSDQLADLRRVAGLTDSEVQSLNNSLGKIDTRTSTGGLREIAVIAGKLGVAKGDILSFTKAVDMLVVSLGDELGDADKITTELGKILNVFEGKITAENISQVGNAIVDLANKGVASGGFLVDFAQRVAGIAKTSNVSLEAVLGLAAGLEESGAKVESSSTAIQKLITDIAKDLPKAAKIAGDDFKEFQKLFAEKPQEALLRYAAGLQKNKGSFAEIAASFKDAGEEGARTVSVLATLGQKTDFFRQKMDDAGKAIKGTDEIQRAFALKNETFGASLDKLSKRLFAFATNNGITEWAKSAVVALSQVFDGFSAVDRTTKAYEDQKAVVSDLEKSVVPLISRYEELKAKTTPTKDEQEELKKVIQQIAQQIPESISEFDKMGNALDINARKAREFVEAQREWLKITNRDAIAEGKRALADIQDQIEQVNRALRRRDGDGNLIKDVTTQVKGAGGEFVTYTKQVKMSGDEITQLSSKLRELQGQLEGQKYGLNQLLGKEEYKINKVVGTNTTNTTSENVVVNANIDDKSVEVATDALKTLQEKIRDIEESILNEQRGRYEREIETVKYKYDKLIKDAEGYGNEISKLKKLEAQEIAAIQQKQNDEIEKLTDQLHFSRLTKEEQEIESIRQKYEQKIADFKGFQDKIKELEDLRDAEIEAKRKDQETKKLQDKIALEDQIWLMTISSNDREVAEEAMKWDELIQKADQFGLDSTNLYKLKGDAISLIVKKQKEGELKDTSAFNKKMLDEEARLWASKKSLVQSNFAIINNLMRIAGENQSNLLDFSKMATLAQLAIDSGSAISSVVAKNAASSLEPIEFAAKVAASIATVLGNIAMAKQLVFSADVPPPPAFKMGGKLPGGTVLPGPSVSDDNLLVVDPTTGNPVARVKSGEPVLSEETYKQNPDLVNALLNASKYNNGKLSIPGMREGGLIDMPLTVPLQPNYENLIRGIRVEKFGSAAMADSINNSSAQDSPAVKADDMLSRTLAEHRAATDELMEKFAKRLEDLEIKGVWDWDYYTKTTDRITKLQTASSMGK